MLRHRVALKFFPLVLVWACYPIVAGLRFGKSEGNGACAHYVMVSKFQWKPFWLQSATQRDPQNDLTATTATQNRVNYDVFAQAPSGHHRDPFLVDHIQCVMPKLLCKCHFLVKNLPLMLECQKRLATPVRMPALPANAYFRPQNPDFLPRASFLSIT